MPVFPAVSIVRERRSGTLALLLNAPLTPLDILLGKLAGSLVFALLLLALSIPAAAACYAMGGIDFLHELLPLYLVLTALALQLASVGLYISTRAPTLDGAIRLTYFLVLSLVLAPLAPYRFLRGLIPTEYTNALEWFRNLSPIPAITNLLGQDSLSGTGLLTTNSPTARFLLLAAATSLLLLALSILRLQQTMLDRPRPKGQMTEDRSFRVRAFRRILFLWFFDPHRRSKLIGDFTNPVLIKELRTSKLGRSHWLARLLGFCLLLSLALMIAAANVTISAGVSSLGGAVIILQFAVIVLLSPALASGLIPAERESGTWRLLQLTPLPIHRILSGKLLAVSLVLGLVLLSTLPSYAVLILIEKDLTPAVLRVLITLALTAVFSISASAAIGSLFAKSTGATAAAFALLLTLIAGTMLIWLGEGQPFSHEFAQRALILNPLAASFSEMKAYGFENYTLLPHTWIALSLGTLLALLTLTLQTLRLSRPA